MTAKEKRLEEIEKRLDELENSISIEKAKLIHECVKLNDEINGED